MASSVTTGWHSVVQVGPIPIDDGLGKEVVTRLESDIQSDKTFYTDSNGRDLIKRVRAARAETWSAMRCHCHTLKRHLPHPGTARVINES